VKLRLLPVGMSRQQCNTSKVVRRKGTLDCLWRVEWLFESCTPALSLVSETLSDAAPMIAEVSAFLSPDPVSRRCVSLMRLVQVAKSSSVLAQLNASLRHKLRAYADVAVTDMQFLYHHPFRVSGKSVFVQLTVNDTSTLRDVLTGKDVLEFPTISVLLPGYDKNKYPVFDDMMAVTNSVSSDPESSENSSSDDDSDDSTSDEESSSSNDGDSSDE
jgi:hypothetical protein